MIDLQSDDIASVLTPIARDLCKDREEAIKARKNSGLEHIWAKAREQYDGKDGMNPGWSKAETLDGPITSRKESPPTERSTVFVNITRPYTNAGTARIADILLPTGKMPWDIKPTPRADLKAVESCFVDYPQEISEILENFPELYSALQQTEETAKLAAEEARNVIKDWLVESDWLSHVRMQISESGIVGTGVLKGPFPQKKKLSSQMEELIALAPMLVSNPDTGLLVQKELENKLYYSPAAECIKVENLFPAPDCGCDIQSGKYIFEKIPDVSSRQLQEMQSDPTYLADQIEACLEEGAKGEGKNTQDKNTPFDLWIRTGTVCIGEDKQFLTVVLCNDRIIKIAEPMLDKETFPYRLLIWERREDSWAGVGIPELMETPQRGLNAAVRALMDNMGYAVGPQILFRKGKIQPKEGDDWKLRAYKFWEMLEDSLSISPDSNNKPFELVEFPSYLDSILPIIQYWLKMAEDTTGLPLLLQGQTKQEAVGVNQQLMNNSTTNLRLIIKRWDDITCRPMIQDFYDWCQLYGPKETHGDATVEAIGSSTMLVKELQMQALLQIGDRILQPVYGKSPSKWMDAFLEGFQIDPASLELSDEERQQLEAAANQPDPSIMVAQIRSETDIAVENIRKASDEFKAILKAQADSLAVSQAREKVETESATEITKSAIQAEAKPAPQGQPSAPTLEAEPVDVDAALQTLGFVE